MSYAQPQAFPVGHKFEVLRSSGEWSPCTIASVENGGVRVRLDPDGVEKFIPTDQTNASLKPAKSNPPPVAVGQNLEVMRSNGAWSPCTIVSVDKEGVRVSLDQEGVEKFIPSSEVMTHLKLGAFTVDQKLEVVRRDGGFSPCTVVSADNKGVRVKLDEEGIEKYIPSAMVVTNLKPAEACIIGEKKEVKRSNGEWSPCTILSMDKRGMRVRLDEDGMIEKFVPSAEVAANLQTPKSAPCPMCGASMTFSSMTCYAEYEHGWVCNNSETCKSTSAKMGPSRWFCSSCSADVCSKCVAPDRFSKRRPTVAFAPSVDRSISEKSAPAPVASSNAIKARMATVPAALCRADTLASNMTNCSTTTYHYPDDLRAQAPKEMSNNLTKHRAPTGPIVRRNRADTAITVLAEVPGSQGSQGSDQTIHDTYPGVAKSVDLGAHQNSAQALRTQGSNVSLMSNWSNWTQMTHAPRAGEAQQRGIHRSEPSAPTGVGNYGAME
jgi:hypothetical protein